MSSINGSGMNDFYSSFFGTTNNTSSYGYSGSSMLGDYAMIKSGSYKKLLNAYYSKQDSSKAESTDEDDKKETDASVASGKLLNVRSDANTLTNALKDLNDASLYTEKKDKDGNVVDQTDDIKKKVTAFVDAYNAYIDSASNSKINDKTVLRSTLRMVNQVASNKNLLKDVGITIGKDNKLTLDEDKLKEAHGTTLDTLFRGSYSMGDQLTQKANEAAKAANVAANSGKHASSYTYNGSYSILGTANGFLDKYL